MVNFGDSSDDFNLGQPDNASGAEASLVLNRDTTLSDVSSEEKASVMCIAEPQVKKGKEFIDALS